MGFLIDCRTCGKQVSSTAKMCPHCGESSPEPYKERIKYTVIGLTGLMLLILVGVSLIALIYWLLW